MPERFAVVIGINYAQVAPTLSSEAAARAGMNALRFAEADAQEIALLLQNAGYSVESLLGAEATRLAIINTIERQSHAARNPGDVLLVYFAGHGDIDPYGRPTAYLLPADADPEAVGGTAIRLDEFVNYHLYTAHTVLTLFDCCHSGYAVGSRGKAYLAGLGEKFGKQVRSTFSNVHGRIVLAACAGDQQARELLSLRHGAFTYYAIEHWKTSDEVTDLSLYQHIVKALLRDGFPSPVRGGVQEGYMVLREAQSKEYQPNSISTQLTPQDRRDIYLRLKSILTSDQFQEFCFFLAVDYDKLSGENFSGKIRSFIQELERSGRIDDLRQLLGEDTSLEAIDELGLSEPDRQTIIQSLTSTNSTSEESEIPANTQSNSAPVVPSVLSTDSVESTDTSEEPLHNAPPEDKYSPEPPAEEAEPISDFVVSSEASTDFNPSITTLEEPRRGDSSIVQETVSDETESYTLEVGLSNSIQDLISVLESLPEGSHVQINVPYGANTMRYLDDYNALRDTKKRRHLELIIASSEPTIIGLSRIYGFDVERLDPPPDKPAQSPSVVPTTTTPPVSHELQIDVLESMREVIERVKALPVGSRVRIYVPYDAISFRTLEDYNMLRDLGRQRQTHYTIASPEVVIIGLSRIYGFDVENLNPERKKPPLQTEDSTKNDNALPLNARPWAAPRSIWDTGWETEQPASRESIVYGSSQKNLNSRYVSGKSRSPHPVFRLRNLALVAVALLLLFGIYNVSALFTTAPSVQISSLVTAKAVGTANKPQDVNTVFLSTETVYAVLSVSSFPKGTSAFARWSRDGSVIEDSPAFAVDRDYHNTYFEFHIVGKQVGLAVGNWIVQIYINGTPGPKTDFRIVTAP
jgi:Caspase domain/Effector-associated domain 7